MPTATASARLKAASDPLRIRIGMLLMTDALTVKELAEALEVPQTRLYYHMKILEQHDLIEVVERRMVSGIEERRYKGIADAWAFPPDESLTTEDMRTAVGAVMRAVGAEIDVVLAADPDDPVGNDAVPVFFVTELALMPDEVEEVGRWLQEINEHFAVDPDKPRPGAQVYNFLVAGYARPRARHAP